MQIGIIGTGNVGSALATGFTAAGHEVRMGSRDPDGTSVDVGGDEDGVAVVSQRKAAGFGDVVVLALPAGAVVDVAGELADSLAGKPVIDAANEYPDRPADQERSLAERVADAAPEAHVVKAFNTIGANRMTDPVVAGDRATMFVAGDDPAATETVERLADDLGFDPLVTGDLARAGRLEDLARLWIDLSREYGRDIAFRLLQD